MLSRRHDKQRKTAQFAAQRGLNSHPRFVTPIDPGQNVTFKSPQDSDIAQEILRNVQTAKSESESRKGLSRMLTKSKPSQFKYREICGALISTVKDNCLPGVVEVLLGLLIAQGGNVNVIPKSTTVWKKVKKIDQEDKRTDLLPTATRLNNVDMAKLLIPHADQLSIDESLNIALGATNTNLAIIDLLLGYGADASAHHAVFTSAAAASNQELVSLLMSAQKPVTRQCTTDALWSAVSAGCLEITFLLGMSDADADNGYGRALKAAVQSNQPDITTALTLCKYPPSSKTLDEAIQLVFSDDSTTSDEKLKLVEILLSAGAKGDGTASTLIHVTELCTTSVANAALIQILKLFMKFNPSLEFNNSAAVRIAIHSSRIPLIEIFLKAKSFNSQLATVGFASINQAAAEEIQLSIGSKLLEKGASGTPLHDALIYAVKTDHIAAVEMLVVRTEPNKASVDYQDAMALKDAIEREKVDLAKLLLSGRPSIASVTKSFNSIWSCSKEGRLVLATELLDHKAGGEPVNASLFSAVADHSPNRDERLIKLLIAKGANVNFADGRAIELAVKNFDIPVLDTLLAGANLQPKSLNLAFTSAMTLRPASRITVCKKLIDAGATGKVVNKALVVAVEEDTTDTSFLRLLTPRADVDYNGGEALNLAIANSLPQHAALLLEQKPKEATFDRAFISAMNNSLGSDQLKYCRILFESSPSGASASTALLKAVKAEKSDLCHLMLEFDASANFQGGAAVVAAVQTQNTSILRLLARNSDPPLSERSLAAGFEAALTVNNDLLKLELARILLEAGLRGKPLDRALISESKFGDKNLPFCSLLLLHKARVNHQNGEALNLATKKGAASLVGKMLEGKRASEASLTRSFNTSQSLHSRTRPAIMESILKAGPKTIRIQEQIDTALLKFVKSRPTDVPSIKVLLENGASVHFSSHSALKHATKTSDNTTLTLLLEYVQDNAATSVVFDWLEEKLTANGFWKTKPGFDTLELLLKNGAKGDTVNKALILAVTDINMEALAEPFLDLLLHWNADVNYNSGRVLQVAATQGNLQILTRLFARNPSVDSSLMAFPYLFISGVGEEGILSLNQFFIEYLGDDLALPYDHPTLPDAIVFLSIRHYPKSDRVLKAVLDAGLLVDQRMPHELGDRGERNNMTALFWALSLPEGTVSESVIETLIAYGATVNDHPQPLLHLAILKGYSRIVKILIQAGAEVDLPSAQGISPLSLAFQKRDFASMDALLAANAETNDGTLHDAARCLDLKAIELLLIHGHDPDCPSIRHDGRGALAELCYRAPETSPRITESEVKKAIKTLVEGGAQQESHTITNDDLGRSLLHLALDSSKPYLMAKAFLECGQYKHVNDDFNLYNDGVYTYSPISYVEKGAWKGELQNRQPVLNLLKQYQVRRRYWGNEGPQPPDMIGAPPDIVESEKLRKADLLEQQRRQFELDERLRLKEQEAQAAIAIKEREHEITKRLDQDRHQTELSALQARLNADVQYKQSQANIENHRNVQQLENLRAQKAIELKTFSDMKALDQRDRQQQLGLIQEERRLVDSRTALGKTTVEVARAELEFRRQNGVGGSRPALGDVSGRANRFLEN